MSEFLPQHASPCCGYVTDCVSELDTPLEPEKPEQGDLLVCINCGALLVSIDPSRNLTRQANPADWKGLPDKLKREIVAAQAYVRKRGWLPGEARRRKNN